MNYIENCSPNKSDTEKEKENIELFLKEVKSNVRKGKYKKVLEDIEVGERKYSNIFFKWQIVDIKISTLFKSFLRFLYQNDLTIMKDHYTVDGFLSKIDKNVEDWFDAIFQNENNLEEQAFRFEFENMITAYVTQLYTYALISKKERKCGDCCAYLGIAEKLVKFFLEKTKNNKFLYIASQIFLFISSLLISDEEYLTAEIYQKQAICVSYRLISYLNPNNEYLDLPKLKKSNRNYVEKAIVAICVAFYHRGNCEETMGNLLKATESYSQARWFAGNFLINPYPELVQFLTDVDIRVSRDARMWIKAQHQGKNKTLIKPINKPIELDKMNELQELKLEYKETIKKIEQLKFPDFDEDRRHHDNNTIHEILYTLRMNNFLMSEDFKNLVADLDKLNIHKMDKDTKEKINKKLVQLRARESYERYCNFINNDDESKIKKINSGQKVSDSKFNIYKTLEPVSSVPRFSLGKTATAPIKLNNLQQYINNTIVSKDKDKETKSQILGINVKNLTFSDENKNKDLNLMSQSYRKAVLQTEISSTSNNNNKDFDLILPENALKFIRTETNKTVSSTDSEENKDNSKKGNKILFLSEPTNLSLNFKKSSKFLENQLKKKDTKKYKYNKFIFNDSYQDKLKALNNNFNKELTFQKQLLRLKKNEKVLVEEIDFKKKSKEYNVKFIKKILEDRKKFVKKKEIKHKKSDYAVSKIRLGKQRNKVEQTVLKSLDSRQLSTLRLLRKEKDEDKITLREEFQLKHNIEEKLEHEQLILEAREKMNTLDKEMELIEKIEKKNMKEIYPILYKERPHTSRKPINDKSKREFNENFTKILSGKTLTSSISSTSNRLYVKNYNSETD